MGSGTVIDFCKEFTCFESRRYIPYPNNKFSCFHLVPPVKFHLTYATTASLKSVTIRHSSLIPAVDPKQSQIQAAA
jgi:hypothetical protein